MFKGSKVQSFGFRYSKVQEDRSFGSWNLELGIWNLGLGIWIFIKLIYSTSQYLFSPAVGVKAFLSVYIVLTYVLHLMIQKP